MMLIPEARSGVLESSEGEIPDRTGGDHSAPEDSPRTRRGQADRHVGSSHRSDRSMSLATAAREYIWLYDLRHGVGIKQTAAREGLSVGRVRYGVARARALEKKSTQNSLNMPIGGNGDVAHSPRLIPLFPIGPYTPQSDCPHHEPIGQGSAFCCMVCHRSGMDEHPALQRDPRTDPAPESRPEPAPQPALQPMASDSLETRKQRRRRKYAQHPARAGESPEETGADDVRTS
jgi:hypothetical protein